MDVEAGPPMTQIATLAKQHEAARSLVWQGRELALHTRAGQTIVTPFVGAIGYHSGLHVLDPHGLVNREVAQSGLKRRARATPGHDLFADIRFFERWKPDYAYVSIVSPELLDEAEAKYCGWFGGCGCTILGWDDEAMLAVYRPVLIRIDDPEGRERYLLLAERDPAPDGSDNGWCEPLLRPRNLRVSTR
jgi:hypothetical protein